MPTGDISWHARNCAFDFVVPKGVDKRDVMVWLDKNSPGVTISYRSMPTSTLTPATFARSFTTRRSQGRRSRGCDLEGAIADGERAAAPSQAATQYGPG